MLENKPTIEINEIYGFKLSTGEEIIAKVKSKDRGEYKFDSPHVIMMAQGGAGLSPWPMIAKEKEPVVVIAASIIAVFQPRDDFKSAYEETVSGIVLPEKSSIIT